MDFLSALDWGAYVAVLSYLPLCLLGLAIHFLKKKVKTENFIEVKQYFTTHLVSTLASLLTAVGLLYIFDAMDQLTVVSAIMAGYATDSLFQKQVDAMVMRDLGRPAGVTPDEPWPRNGPDEGA
jgi:hypothetical protein